MKMAKNLELKTEQLTNEQKASNVKDFILKLAGDESSPRHEVIEAIVNQIDQISENLYFPDIFEKINPDEFHSETKLLNNYSKNILREAVEVYSEKYKEK